MRPKLQLLQSTTRLTLFTRPHCGLCDSAKLVLQNLGKRKGFEMKQIDIMDPAQSGWKMIYEFDTPVLHIQRVSNAYAQPDLATDPRKLMHRFSEAQIERIIDEVEENDELSQTSLS